MDDRLLGSEPLDEDRGFEASLRPKRMAEYIGQDKVKDHLSVFIQAARQRQEPLDHVLLFGPPGLGKTTLAHVVANEMQANLRITSGPAIEKAGDLAAILTNLENGDVLFVDEIHRMPRTVEEVLYPALEDFNLDVVLGKGPTARSIRLELPRFTLIGATTRPGRITLPLRERFGFSPRLDYYPVDDMRRIVRRSGGILALRIDEEGAEEIARRSRGTPRIANRLLRRVRDFAQVRHDGAITGEVSRAGLELFEVDEEGLDRLDHGVLRVVVEKFGGGPVGLSTLASALGEEPDTIEDVVEPYLMQLGFLKRTPRGRVATERAFRHLGIGVPGTLPL